MEQNDMTLAELERLYLSDESAAEFDRVVSSGDVRRRRAAAWGTMLAAAVLAALVLMLWPHGGNGFSGLEMAEGIEQILELAPDEIVSVTAKPDGGKVVLAALMNDGSRRFYVMSREKVTSAVTITAENNLKNK